MNEQERAAPRGTTEQGQAAPPKVNEEERARLPARLGYNLAVKVAVFIAAIAIHGAFLAFKWQSRDSEPALFLIVPLSIVASALWLFRYGAVKYEVTSPFAMAIKFDLNRRTTQFPLIPLAWDFVNLALLVAFTGGIASIFLPLFVVALLLGDISVPNGKRRAVQALFVSTLVLGVVVPEVPPLRYALINLGKTPCAKSMWDAPNQATIALALLVFMAGALFGSIVIGRYAKKAENRYPSGVEAESTR